MLGYSCRSPRKTYVNIVPLRRIMSHLLNSISKYLLIILFPVLILLKILRLVMAFMSGIDFISYDWPCIYNISYSVSESACINLCWNFFCYILIFHWFFLYQTHRSSMCVIARCKYYRTLGVSTVVVILRQFCIPLLPKQDSVICFLVFL